MDIAEVFANEWHKIVATVSRDFGDIELAEDAAQTAFSKAHRLWRSGLPKNPGAWLTTTARNYAIDTVRRSKNYSDKLALMRDQPGPDEANELLDPQLSLLLTCCHPALNLESQVALTLRLVGGLTTDQIASAFRVDSPTMGKRLTRAKNKIKAAGISVDSATHETLLERVESIRNVIYLIFNEGYASNSTNELIRGSLCDEALWFAQLLCQLDPGVNENYGLQALVAFNDSRRNARTDREGLPVLLEDQDRTLWNPEKIGQGESCLRHLNRQQPFGPYSLQSLISYEHVAAMSFEDTNWQTIYDLYTLLLTIEPNPIIQLNQYVALSYLENTLGVLDKVELLETELSDYLYWHTTKAQLFARAGQVGKAVECYQNAVALTSSESEHRWIRRQIDKMT